ncbi:monofunctional biosynthetic peptidoglycan transglycosylase [Syntrophobacteraceae bacterium DRH4]|nr:monofunctional biosynthetic peptidoglycan transglycosylase [Desulfoferrobacter suflitae]MCK8602773.1 monofunctional biosynthetic peptidoglycan transglycosylase [Desulfoferrobacter suflitae]
MGNAEDVRATADDRTSHAQKTRADRSSRRRLAWLLRAAAKSFIIVFAATFLSVLILKWVDPPTSSFMLQKTLGELFSSTSDTIHYQWVDYADISAHAKMAVVAAEDQNFPNHWGFDFEAIGHAWNERKKGGRLRGASTISQQVAKNLFLWSGRSYLRKALEAYFTLLIELTWSKQRILEVYLNLAQTGEKTFGMGAASEVYFDVPASRLNRQQATLIAAVLPNPGKYSVVKPSRYVRYRQRWILKQMSQLGGSSYLAGL